MKAKARAILMRSTRRVLVAGVLLAGGALTIGTTPGSAQSLASRSPLGGYGAASSAPMAAGASSSVAVIPFAGSYAAFMPYRTGGDNRLTFSVRGTSAMESTRTSFSLSSMTGAMSAMPGGVGLGYGVSPHVTSTFGSLRGMGLGAGMWQQTSRAERMSVMPPSFGYPFYQPPSALIPYSTSIGFGMSSM
jgi:hypothetical protein